MKTAPETRRCMAAKRSKPSQLSFRRSLLGKMCTMIPPLCGSAQNWAIRGSSMRSNLTWTKIAQMVTHHALPILMPSQPSATEILMKKNKAVPSRISSSLRIMRLQIKRRVGTQRDLSTIPHRLYFRETRQTCQSLRRRLRPSHAWTLCTSRRANTR